MWTGIWLEVTKARREGKLVSVQVKGDREDRDPVWWPIHSTLTARLEADAAARAGAGALIDPEASKAEGEKAKAAESAAAELVRQLFDGLDKNRLVTVRLVPTGPENGEALSYLACVDVRIQSADSSLR